MQASKFAVIRPYLEQAVSDIDDLLTRLQQNEEVQRGHQKFCDAWETGRRGDDLPDLEPTAMAWGHPWKQSARTAAAWLKQAGLETEAIGIEIELAELPTHFSTDPDHPEYLPKQNIIAKEAAERVKTILTAVLAGSKDQDGQPQADRDGTGSGAITCLSCGAVGGPARPTKGKIIVSLQDERLQRLHRQFLDAARQYPDLCLVAASAHPIPDGAFNLPLPNGEMVLPTWPEVPYPGSPGDRHLGLHETHWCELLRKPRRGLPLPLHAVWLRIGGVFWCLGSA